MTADLLPKLALIPAGEFVMGSDAADDDEKPAHPVHVGAFHLGVHPVSNAEYLAFVQATGHPPPVVHQLPLVVTAGGAEREQMFLELSAAYLWPNGAPSPDRMSHPVTLVRWDDARAYCDWLSASTGRTVFLPTEAQWERAARGGVDGNRYPWGQQPDRAMANFLPAPATKKLHGTTECGTYPPNPYGLFDMVGNVWEWVADWYAADYYTNSPRVDPQGPGRGYYRILRGGGWPTSDVRMLTCSHRHEVPPDTYSYAIGFRIACAV